jgi:hypothetical protein
MHKSSFAATILATALLATAAHAETFSTSALAPSPVPPGGVITGSYPAGGAETTYYFAADLKAGELATQISMMGRAGRDKSLEIGLVDPAGKRAGGYYVMTGLDANQELARVLPIDNSGRHVIRVTTKGPETTTFRIELGGDALGNPQKTPAAKPFSASFLDPTPVPADGVIAGKFPMSGDGVLTYYYFGANMKAGQLMSQLSFAGRKNTPKTVEFTLLNAKGRSVGGYYIMGELDANQEATKAIPIDATGPYVLRLSLKGAENTNFKLELGGDAIAAK